MKAERIDLRQMALPADFCDCRFFCFRILLSRYGLFPTEEDMLGIGEGLAFRLVNVSTLSTKVYCPVGRDMDFEPVYGQKTGINLQACQFDRGSVEDVIAPVRRKIDSGDPVVANVDRYYLDYLSIQRAHVGYHTVLVFGYDDGARTLQVLDGLTGSRVIDLPYDVFHKAVLSDCVVPTNRRWFCVEGAPALPLPAPGEDVVREALRNTCRRVLAETESAFGFTEAMRRYAAAGSAPQIRKFLDIQGSVFFPSFYEQDRTRCFYRKTFFAFLLDHFEIFPDAFKQRILYAGNDLITAVQTVHDARQQGAGQELPAFEAYIRKEQALHQLLLSALDDDEENKP